MSGNSRGMDNPQKPVEKPSQSADTPEATLTRKGGRNVALEPIKDDG